MFWHFIRDFMNRSLFHGVLTNIRLFWARFWRSRFEPNSSNLKSCCPNFERFFFSKFKSIWAKFLKWGPIPCTLPRDWDHICTEFYNKLDNKGVVHFLKDLSLVVDHLVHLNFCCKIFTLGRALIRWGHYQKKGLHDVAPFF